MPIVATVFVMLFVWLSMAPLLSWYEFGGYAEELDDASFKWSNSGVTSYSYVYEVSSYFALPPPGPIRVIVHNSKLSSVTIVESGKKIDIATIPGVPVTIELLYELITTLLAEYPREIDVEYDVVLGYPKKIIVNSGKTTDDEATYFVKSFKVIQDGV